MNKRMGIICIFWCLTVIMAFFSVPVFAEDGSLNLAVLQSLQQRFPDGKYWDHLCTDVSITKSDRYSESVTDKPCWHKRVDAETVGSYDCNHFDGGGQCAGFARKLFYEYFGVYATKQPESKNINDLKPGDTVRYHPAGYSHDHSIWVTAVSGDTVTYADCNVSGPCQIRWNVKTTKSEIKKSLIYIKKSPFCSVKIESDIPVLYVSQANTFLYSVSSNFSKSDVQWKAEPADILEVSNRGDIKGKKAGTAVVTAYVQDQSGKILCSSSKTVTVKTPSIKLNKTSATVYGNEVLYLNATVEGPSNQVTWKSSSTLYNTVKGEGLSASVKTGSLDLVRDTTTTITATANGVSASCTVTRKPGYFEFVNKNIVINAGSTGMLSIIKKGTGNVSLSSSDKTIVTVSAGGQVKGLKAGQVYVTGSSGKIKKQCTVTVKPAIKLNKTDVTLRKGKTLQLISKVIGTKNRVKWSSSKKSVVSVSSRGKLTAKKSGQAIITVYVKTGSLSAKATCKVKVIEPSIKLNKTSLKLKTGENVTLKATVKNTTGKISWKSSKSSVASVNSNGTTTARKAGKATITATINGKKAKCKVTVKKVPVSIRLSATNLTLTEGKTYILKANVLGTTKKPVWRSSNMKAAVVDSNGKITAKAYGTTVITAAVDGKIARCTVKVEYKPIEVSGYIGWTVENAGRKLGWTSDEIERKCPNQGNLDIWTIRGSDIIRVIYLRVSGFSNGNYHNKKYCIHGVCLETNIKDVNKMLVSSGWKIMTNNDVTQLVGHGYTDLVTKPEDIFTNWGGIMCYRKGTKTLSISVNGRGKVRVIGTPINTSPLNL